MVRWGVMSPGSHLDTKIVPAMKSLPDTEVVAVFSRSQQRADEFAERHDIPFAYDSIESFGKHDMDAVFALADRVSVINYGKIVATGTVDEIRQNELVRDVYLGYEI